MNTPSSRFRLLQFEPALRNAGIELHVLPPPFAKSGSVPGWVRTGALRWLYRRFLQLVVLLPRRLLQVLRADLPSFDAVIIQKRLLAYPHSAMLERLIHRLNGRIVFDLDDAEFADAKGVVIPRSLAATRKTASLAKFTFVCNAYLEEVLHGCGTRIVHVHTTVDESRFAPAVERHRDRVTVGWTGSGSNIDYLREVLPALERILGKPHVRLLVISDRDIVPWMAHLPRTEFARWSAMDEVDQLRRIDIGLMPLPDNLWTRGKCAFKIVQYMAMGIPCVASPVGFNTQLVVPGVTGFLPNTAQQWDCALEMLVDSEPTRRKFGAEARARYLRDLRGSHVAQTWVDHLRLLAEDLP